MIRFISVTTFLFLFAHAGYSQQVYLLDMNILQKNKAAYQQNHPETVDKVRMVMKEADEILSARPHSVMDKLFTPSSGSKHDYMSMGPYWWPDPSKPDGLPYIRKDGQRNPEIRKITDREYLGELETRCKYLALAYYFSGEQRYAQKAQELLRVWFTDTATRMNPNLTFGQAIPGLNEGRGIGIIETRLLVYLTDWIGLLSTHDQFKGTELNSIKKWYNDYIHWLVTSKNGIDEAATKNNHGTFYELQVATFAAFAGNEPQLQAALKRLVKRMNEQFEGDGKQPLELERTNAYSYSSMNLSGWYSLAMLAERSGINLWNFKSSSGAGLREAMDWLIPYFLSEKEKTYEQINSLNPEDIYPLLRISAIKYKNSKYQEIAKKFKPTKQTALIDLTY